MSNWKNTSMKAGFVVGTALALSLSACAGSSEGSNGDGDGDTGDGDTADGGTTSGDGGSSSGGSTSTGGDTSSGGIFGAGGGDGCEANYAVYVLVRGGGTDPNTLNQADEGADIAEEPEEKAGIPDVALEPCYATVKAVDGSYVEEPVCTGGGGDCHCYVGANRPGTYSVTATYGELTETKVVDAPATDCGGVEPQTVEFF